LLGAVAEDHAIEDLYYELDKMLEDGRIRLDDFIKHTRKAARDQFSARLLVRRIQEKQKIS
jgi:ESCRT-I complex subunit TSG101